MVKMNMAIRDKRNETELIPRQAFFIFRSVTVSCRAVLCRAGRS